MDLSVMFFGADSGSDSAAGSASDGGPPHGSGTAPSHAQTYDDILTLARAADRLGFHAVWTPERHFQQVGQVFPSPPVLSAALAVATERIKIRAGSVVLPLHHPLKVAEEWAVVDNLSHGRAGLSVATGWHSTDFTLAPGHYEDRRRRTLEAVPELRRLWAGEAVTYPDGTGRPVAVVPQPRPVQRELPLWITTSGNPETWETAGRLRAGVLGATVGQTRDELADRIDRYRTACAAAPDQAGTDAHGRVTLMAHTYVGADDAEVHRLAAAPLKAYLASYLRQTAANRAAKAREGGELTGEQTALLAEFAFRRYLNWGSLLGSPGTCAKMLADLRDLGCDEVACFIDFGIGRDEVVAGLHRLAELREAAL
ncbi:MULTISPECIES: MupA/Atu3671 family FMN-dependent luciferase-like monooxygenase [Streptomyces]|uniref:MupA/Atu3671 family FMN-dependent luciferase-like monooxygenase n=1 Tax=Streptomyces TaxID=1883 RepID=UPI001E5B35FA|nr:MULTISPECIES: MupA/Atu3671 family FMN-dependent luciferase-like monooxygenase [Streptomyces]UFQ18047.1 LLM class flavin-dependent oxidoreductase [Streptomyces huasconensis]WCL87658.1 LLM class flavin-dependent oxidoreductase [Streptomyces sp. JCM 35825]